MLSLIDYGKVNSIRTLQAGESFSAKFVQSWEFPGGPGVRTRCFCCQGPGSIPGWGTKSLQALWQTNKQTNICRTFWFFLGLKQPPPPGLLWLECSPPPGVGDRLSWGSSSPAFRKIRRDWTDFLALAVFRVPEFTAIGFGLFWTLFGHLMWRTDSLEKTLMLGKIEGRRRRGQQRMR